MTDIPIIFEDGEALVINKPAGISVDRPKRGGPCLEDHFEQLRLGFQRDPSPVHRLDTDTSGCLLLARYPKALKRFAKAFEDRLVTKRYVGVLAGIPEGEEGTIELSLSKISSAEKGWRMIAAKRGKPAITHWQRLGVKNGITLVKFFPAEPAGGVRMLQALGGPFPTTNFLPTGGIDESNLESYLRLPMVAACGASWLVDRELIRTRDFASITARTARFVDIVHGARLHR